MFRRYRDRIIKIGRVIIVTCAPLLMVLFCLSVRVRVRRSALNLKKTTGEKLM